MRRLGLTALIIVALMLGAFACSASEIEVTRVVEIEVTREVPIEIRHEIVVTHEVEVPVEVVREVEVIRNVEVPVEVARKVEVTRVVVATPTSTPTPSPSPTLSPTNTPTPTVDVGDVDYVRDIEIPAEFVAEAANAAAAYCDNRTFSVSHEVNDHFHGFFEIESGTDECRADALAAMAVRSKRMSETRSRYIFQGNKMNECHSDFHNDSYYSQGNRLQEKCNFMDLYPARHSPDYDREKLIVMFEDQPPEYPFDYLLTEDELWARNQIWRSVIRYYHYQCMRRAESEAGRVLYFDRGSYIGHLPGIIDNWLQFDDIPPYYWGSDGPDIGLCSAYDIKTRSEYFMWGYDSVYFSALATGWVLSNADPGSNDFAGDLAAMRANPPEIPNRFAASGAGE